MPKDGRIVGQMLHYSEDDDGIVRFRCAVLPEVLIQNFTGEFEPRDQILRKISDCLRYSQE